ncbi:3-phosphoshikimate 1-carboxyvinyltransferase [Daejeonella oryzae]|uniref:3-phosphoshikimate 1-carboxyvinyltransferase n=1 Tax=Daejeonella oryzae TaxID=1122943 RepID=UPI000403B618|nr:3-phosphoshikimate 1-carboxyvinyltransferase [Daejeonella oryzae]
MNTIQISAASKDIKCTIELTGSKSESNRALILNALSKNVVQVKNLSTAADTVTLDQILKTEISTDNTTLDVGPAGTAMRFLTAYASAQNSEVVLTGSERMLQRPVKILVDALREIGANIDYLGVDGFPPLKIKGPLVKQKSSISVKGDISSQYISALLLIAPTLDQGLELRISGELTSMPYVEMTLAMLEQAGIKSDWQENRIQIDRQDFKPSTLSIEPDWSAASYWYAIAALSDSAEIFLPGLTQYSLQGDSRITEIMANFGITSQFINDGVLLTKENKKLERRIFDFKDCPDLAQTVIVCCAALGHDASFTGLETLKIKETDRVKALQTELQKIGVKLIEKNLTCKLDCSGLKFPEKLKVSTYEDHRMAMAFAPLALLIPELEIEDPQVVEKSYPGFWNDLEKAGFRIK